MRGWSSVERGNVRRESGRVIEEGEDGNATGWDGKGRTRKGIVKQKGRSANLVRNYEGKWEEGKLSMVKRMRGGIGRGL